MNGNCTVRRNGRNILITAAVSHSSSCRGCRNPERRVSVGLYIAKGSDFQRTGNLVHRNFYGFGIFLIVGCLSDTHTNCRGSCLFNGYLTIFIHSKNIRVIALIGQCAITILGDFQLEAVVAVILIRNRGDRQTGIGAVHCKLRCIRSLQCIIGIRNRRCYGMGSSLGRSFRGLIYRTIVGCTCIGQSHINRFSIHYTSQHRAGRNDRSAVDTAIRSDADGNLLGGNAGCRGCLMASIRQLVVACRIFQFIGQAYCLILTGVLGVEHRGHLQGYRVISNKSIDCRSAVGCHLGIGIAIVGFILNGDAGYSKLLLLNRHSGILNFTVVVIGIALHIVLNGIVSRILLRQHHKTRLPLLRITQTIHQSTAHRGGALHEVLILTIINQTLREGYIGVRKSLGDLEILDRGGTANGNLCGVFTRVGRSVRALRILSTISANIGYAACCSTGNARDLIIGNLRLIIDTAGILRILSSQNRDRPAVLIGAISTAGAGRGNGVAIGFILPDMGMIPLGIQMERIVRLRQQIHGCIAIGIAGTCTVLSGIPTRKGIAGTVRRRIIHCRDNAGARIGDILSLCLPVAVAVLIVIGNMSS